MKTQKIHAVGLVLLNAENKVLVVFKKMTKVWEFPQGTVEKGEELLDTLHREIEEEVSITDFELLEGFQENTYYRFQRDNMLYDKTVTYFLGRTTQGVRLSEEHLEYRWCSFDEAMNLFRYENHKEVLKKAFEKVS